MKRIDLDQSQHVGVVWDALANFLMKATFQEGLCLFMKGRSILIDWGGISGPNVLKLRDRFLSGSAL